MGQGVVEIRPRELQFTFELKKQSSCSVHLVNKSDEYVAFKVKTTSPKRYCIRPNTGVIRPKATCDFTVTMQAQRTAPPDMQLKDKFLVQTTVVPPGTSDEDLIPAFFSKETNAYIDESKLRVVLVDASHPSVEQLINSVPSTDAAVEVPVSRHRNLLAPKKDGYFVLNDIFKFTCDEYDDQYHGTDYCCLDAPYAMAETEEILSVYVGNLSPSTSVFDLEKVFKAFGGIKPDGVAIRSRKETGVFFGFVEFEDHSGINNALNAPPIELNGRLLHVEERRPNCVFPQGGTTDYFTGEHEAREVDAPAKNHEVHRQAPSPPIPEEEPVEEAPKTYASAESTLQAETEVQNSGETSVSVVEKSNDTHHVASVPEDEEFLLEGAERAKLEADFEKACETIKDRRRLNWGDNATELFWKICNNKIDSIPKAEREWTGNTIIRDISLEIFYRTKVAYSSKQLFNKWRNMNKAPPKKKETNKAHGKKKEEDHRPLTAACEESEDDVQHLYKELEQLKINNKEYREEKQMLIEKITHLEAELNKAEALRRGMLNQILELKGSIRVFCRVRPSLKEDESHNKSLLSFPRTGQFVGRRVYLEHQGVKVSFTCDRVFDHSDSQEMIFREISELVQSALDGKKVCIFAYGQTGSGKTYTMLGEDGDCTKGIIPRALEKIFETAESRESHGSFHTIKISMIEIYNGKTWNLSSVDQAEVKTTAEALEALNKALGNRSVAKTMRNDKSSRSHFIFELSIYSYDKEKNVSEGILSIIDLAGSEQPETNASEERKNEATEINKSLLSLGIMINAIESGLAYLNHRDSTLTKELKSSLAKDTKVLMFINVAPEEACADETNATFEFAARIKSCTKTVIHEKGIHEKMVFESPGVSRASRGKDASVLKFLSRNNTRIVNRQGPSFRKNFDVAPSCKKRKMYIND